MRVLLRQRSGRVAGAGETAVDIGRQEISRDGRAVALPPIVFRTAAVLVVRAPGVVYSGEIIDHVWGDDRSGGPENIAAAVWRAVRQARERLASLGIDVRNHGCRRYSASFAAVARETEARAAA